MVSVQILSMFLRRRSAQAEYFDTLRSGTELQAFYRSLNSVNRLCLFAEPFKEALPRLLRAEACRSLSILDLGAGDGFLSSILKEWAKGRGWDWTFINLDINLDALRLGDGRRVAGSVLALPFKDGSVDVVIASQMSHHFESESVVKHLGEAWRVAGKAIVISDVHRNPVLYALLGALFRLGNYPRHFSDDGLLSVKRGWRVPELRELARTAGLRQSQVRLYFGARVMLEAVKDQAPA